ncbi:hypothetical protein OSB04_019590 [Centaurea solstitialis]|uniref:Uncharacterized protein n=1 Tax=Centaurea solstitialis TaxID=347529 RepID=A0AA38T940_9ASTR|nr:hypothetical protein OSB04_019590 [Centaurea solstitialis]
MLEKQSMKDDPSSEPGFRSRINPFKSALNTRDCRTSCFRFSGVLQIWYQSLSIMSHETDPSEYRSHGSPKHPGSENGNSRSRTTVPERDPYSDSDADSHQVPARSASPARPFGPETRYGLRGRRTARKSVPLPTRMTFRIPTGDGAGPSRVRGQGGSSSSSSSSSSGSPPPYRPSSPIVRVPPPPPVARPPPDVRPPPLGPAPRYPHMARAPVLCMRGMTPTERQEVARLARGQDIHEHLLDHHDHMIDSLLGVAGADSQQLTRIVALLSHTMASLHHLYTVVYLVVTVVVLLLLWAVWRKHASKKREPGLDKARIGASDGFITRHSQPGGCRAEH